MIELQIHSKPQEILKHLFPNHSNFNGLKHRRLKSVNNSNYDPVDIS